MSVSKQHPLALVTGANGFIGSHLVEALLGRGWQVRALVRPTSDLRWLKGLNVQLACSAFDDPSSLAEAAKGVDYIFHNAAAKSGTRQRLFRDNVKLTMALAETAIRVAPGLKRFIFLSSQAAAGPSAGMETVRCESDQCRPLSDYGQSKLEAELRLMGSAGRFPVTIIRPPTVYGPRDRDVFLYFKWIDRGLALLPGLGKRYVQVIYIDDLVRGLIEAATSQASIGEIYFLSDPRIYSWQDISAAISRSLGKKPMLLPLPLSLARFSAILAEAGARMVRRDSIFNRQKVREMSQRFWTCSPRKAEIDFGFKCRYGLEQGIDATASWYRTNGWLRLPGPEKKL